jgi:hypothetical protein
VYQAHQRGKWIRDRQPTGAFGSTFQEGRTGEGRSRLKLVKEPLKTKGSVDLACSSPILVPYAKRISF